MPKTQAEAEDVIVGRNYSEDDRRSHQFGEKRQRFARNFVLTERGMRLDGR